LIADRPADFAQQVVELLHSPALRAGWRKNGRRLVAERYDWNVVGGATGGLVERVAAGRAA